MKSPESIMKILIISFSVIFSIQMNAQTSLIHNTDKNNLVNFSEALDYLKDFNSNSLPGKVYTLGMKNYGYLLVVKSLEECRKIPAEKKEFLSYAFKTMGFQNNAADIFKDEVLVETDNGKFWFPIQDELFGYWTKELKKGDLVLIYIRFYGIIKDISGNDLIFTINSFNSNYYDGLWEEALNTFSNEKDTIGVRCVKKLISLNPNDGRNYAMLGYYYTTIGKRNMNDKKSYAKADSLFTISEKLTPEYSYQYFQRAILKFNLGDYFQSWKYVEKAKSLNDKHIEQSFLQDLESKYPYEKFINLNK
jgi:tetratricopeptide (TPR) repeat protein